MNENRQKENEEKLKLLKALNDPTRLLIVELLSGVAGTPIAVHIIAKFVEVRPAVVSHHLTILKEALLVSYVTCGQSRLYKINLETLEKLDGMFKFQPKSELIGEIKKSEEAFKEEKVNG